MIPRNMIPALIENLRKKPDSDSKEENQARKNVLAKMMRQKLFYDAISHMQHYYVTYEKDNSRVNHKPHYIAWVDEFIEYQNLLSPTDENIIPNFECPYLKEYKLKIKENQKDLPTTNIDQ